METDKVDDEKAMEEVGRDIYEVCHILGLFEKTMSYLNVKSILNVCESSLVKQLDHGGNRKFHDCVVEMIRQPKQLFDLYHRYKKEFQGWYCEFDGEVTPIPLICACEYGRMSDVELFINLHPFHKYIKMNNVKESNMTWREMVNQYGRKSWDEWSGTAVNAAEEEGHHNIVDYLHSLLFDGVSDAKTLHRFYEDAYHLSEPPPYPENEGTPLQIASGIGRFDDVKLFITSHDVNESGMTLKDMVNQINRTEKTALYNAVFYENANIVQYLLQHGADPTITGRFGATVLHIAAIYNKINTDTIKTLLKFQSVRNLINQQTRLYLGQGTRSTPLDYALCPRYWEPPNPIKQEIIALLRSMGGRTNHRDINGNEVGPPQRRQVILLD